MRTGELACTNSDFSTQESRACSSPGYSGADGKGMGVRVGEQESWSNPSQAAELDSIGPTPLLGSTVELALRHGYR